MNELIKNPRFLEDYNLLKENGIDPGFSEIVSIHPGVTIGKAYVDVIAGTYKLDGIIFRTAEDLVRSIKGFKEHVDEFCSKERILGTYVDKVTRSGDWYYAWNGSASFAFKWEEDGKVLFQILSF